MSENKLFEEYMDEQKPGFFKTPKGWMILIVAIIGVILAILFYKSAVIDTMGGEELKNSVEIVWHDTEWVDKESTPQEIKIVPSIRLKIKNTGERDLQYMDIEAVFVYEETGLTFSEGWVNLFKEPLKPGETSEEIVIKAGFGYSATSKAAFMQNKVEWKKMQVKLFSRARGSSLVRIGELLPVKQVIAGYDESAGQEEKPVEYSDEATEKLARSIQVVSHDSMWVDKAATRKEVIIVPSVTIEIKNLGQQPLEHLYFKGEFKYDDTGEVLSEGLTPGLKKDLKPGETSKEITIKADFGYSASSKEAFFRNNQKWKRLKVRVYVKSRDTQYALLGTYPIKQKIQGVKVVYH
jgi:hypothetical protein